MELLPWMNLYICYKKINYSEAENHRKFRDWTGVHPLVAEKIFNRYSDVSFMPNRTRLLIVLHFLKKMPTEDEGASEFQIASRTTYRKHLWDTLFYLDYHMNEIKIEER